MRQSGNMTRCPPGLQEAKRLVKAGLPIPAYMQLLKLSHSFNIMDSRGAVGVTLRATCFGAMRKLAKQIAGDVSAHIFSYGIQDFVHAQRLVCPFRRRPLRRMTPPGNTGMRSSSFSLVNMGPGPAGLWLKRREELKFPLGIASDLQPRTPAQLQGGLSSEPADLVIEVGCEELPPADATSAVTQLR